MNEFIINLRKIRYRHRNIFKILILGSLASGKTNLFYRINDKDFMEHTMATIGYDKGEKKIQLENGLEITLISFDTAGTERFRSMALNSVRFPDCILLIYDITKRESYDEAINSFNKDINTHLGFLKLKYLIGNKIDCEKEREISKEEAKKFAEENGFYFFEISCKTCRGKDDLFRHLIDELCKIGGITNNNKIQKEKRKKPGKKS